MKVAEFENTIESKLKADPHYLDKLDNATCLVHPSEINNLLAEQGQPLLTINQLEDMWRAWPFKVTLEDGDSYFLAWDIGNGAFTYSCKFTHKDIVRVLNQTVA